MFLMMNISSNDCETIPECKENFKRCCDGYFWNLTINRCELCMPGYSGLNCTTRCPYPSYGYRCQGYCDCGNDTCDVSTGCRTITSAALDPLSITPDPTSSNIMNKTEIFSAIQSESTKSTVGQPSPTSNKTLHILIILFGGVDIILICIHSAICVSDRRRQKRKIAMKNIRNIPGKNSAYENVEIAHVC